jgi:signal transduction histidine kinase
VPVSAREVAEGGWEGRAVSIQGRVVDTSLQTDYAGFAVHTLWMEAGENGFTAIVQKRKPAAFPVKAGDHVRLSGVISALPPVAGRGATFRVNLNDFSDISVLPPPPAWQNPRLLHWLAGAAGVALLAGGWIVILRRQVAVQTARLRENALQLQQQLDHEKELSEMKSRFVFTVSHEFRNPLAIIMSCSDVLQRLRDKLAPEQHQRQIEGIQQSVRRMADMMEEVLLLGRADAGQLECSPEETDLDAFCQRLVDQTQSATAGRCRVQLECEGALEPMAVDRSLLQHILTNLLSNAVKYSPPDAPVVLRVSQGETAAVFTVADCGPGIPPQDHAQLFEPFHRGANVGATPGTGLGLAIVKHCVEAHGGSVACESSESGTAFTVCLPRSVAKPALPSPAAQDLAAAPQPA